MKQCDYNTFLFCLTLWFLIYVKLKARLRQAITESLSANILLQKWSSSKLVKKKIMCRIQKKKLHLFIVTVSSAIKLTNFCLNLWFRNFRHIFSLFPGICIPAWGPKVGGDLVYKMLFDLYFIAFDLWESIAQSSYIATYFVILSNTPFADGMFKKLKNWKIPVTFMVFFTFSHHFSSYCI